MSIENLICPCDCQHEYTACCGKIHKNISLAKTALDLMRSRYSAFVLANINYLSESHAIKTRKSFNPKETKRWTKSVLWKRLKIISTTKGLMEDKDGIVEFKAYYIENGNLEHIHGNSRFIRDKNDHWNYLDEI